MCTALNVIYVHTGILQCEPISMRLGFFFVTIIYSDITAVPIAAVNKVFSTGTEKR